MRKILITRGVPGSGKSTAIRNLGLEDFCISTDRLRLLHSNPVMTASGDMTIPQDLNSVAWGMVFELLERRTDMGDFLVLDATNEHLGDFLKIHKLARRRRYEVACLDFFPVPIEQALAQNQERVPYARVPEHVVRRMHKNMGWSFPEDVRVFSWDEQGNYLAQLERWLRVPVHDLSDYRRVVHIGDVQGCFTPLAGRNGLLANGFRDEDYYIFVGDLLDRGPENGKVLRWFIDEAAPRDNVLLIWGNHEDHILRWANGEECRSGEFGNRSLPQILAEGITPDDVLPMLERMQECFFYRYGDRKVMVSHGGLSDVPADPVILPGHMYSRGTGYWNDSVDEQFERNAPEGWYQVHGHRNSQRVPLRADARSFNLEASVEFGGHLRAVVLDENGFTPVEVRNRVYIPFRDRVSRRTVATPEWMRREDDGGLYVKESDWETFRTHTVKGRKALRLKESERYPHVTSVNFSKHVFYNSSWDDVTVRARGLFLNNRTGEVVARSYDKFFNLNEREETTPESLAQNLVWPVTVYAKENGYLGILGYDSETDELFFASKSTPEGFFADNFRRIVESKIPQGRLEELRRYLRDTESSFVFEVIDPVNDPHIIEYPEEDVILLDVFRRSLKTEKLPYAAVKKVAKHYGINAKEYRLTINNQYQLEGWLAAASARDYSKAKPLEGFVLEDGAGFQVKIKLFHYTFWKAMRTVKDRVRAALESGKDISAIQPDYGNYHKRAIWSHPEAIPFLEFCKALTAEELKRDILTLKRQFQEHLREIEAQPPEEQPEAGASLSC